MRAETRQTLAILRNRSLKGDVDAMWQLGLRELDWKSTSHTAKSAIALKRLREAARGNLDYQFQLGTMLVEGYGGLPKQIPKGIELLRKAARKGNSDAQYQLGVYFGTGTGGLERDRAASVKWYEKAAAQGNSTAMYNLAVAYSSSKSVMNLELARKWLVKGAQLGNEECLEWLSECLRTGQLGFKVGEDLSKFISDSA